MSSSSAVDLTKRSTPARPAAKASPPPPVAPGLARTNTRRTFGLLALLGILVLILLISLAVGTKAIAFADVVRAVFQPTGTDSDLIVRDLRVPRTLLGLVAGISLGLAGALIQAMTRNPLADPGILGVNAGAAFFVVVSIAVFGLTSVFSYIWFAFFGAIVATVAVYLLGSIGRGGATPIRLTLAGVAMGAVLDGITTAITLLNPRTFDRLRFWNAGSLAGRNMEVFWQILPFLVIGMVLALALSGELNATAMGEDLAKALGTNIVLIRVIGVVAVTLLCGGATAAVGPIGFLGLMIPHVARWLIGPDWRWIMAYTVVLSPILLLAADVVGRIVVRPSELQVGIVTAALGAPVLIILVRRRKASGL